jgi:Tfp pilus assembly protein PilN
MIEINLLPKNYLKGSRGVSLGKIGIYSIAGAAAVIVMLVGITFYQMYQLSSLEQSIEKANRRAAVLQRDIRLVDALTDVKQKINDRMVAVEQLDRHRSVWVRILEDIARNIPEFVWLGVYREVPEEVVEKASNQTAGGAKSPSEKTEEPPPELVGLPSQRPVEIEGYAFTLNALASLMINMMRSDYFDEVELMSTRETIFGTEREKAYNFVVSSKVHYLSDEDLRSLIAQANDEANQSKTTHKVLN